MPPPDSGLPRIDARGYPIRPSDGGPVDNIGRLVNDKGQPIDDDGKAWRDPDGRPLPPAPRTKVCDADRAALRLRGPPRGRLVSLLRRARSASSGTAAPTTTGGSTATPRFDGLLLRRPQGLLRHLLPDQRPMLTAVLGASVSGSSCVAALRCSPASRAPGRRAGSRWWRRSGPPATAAGARPRSRPARPSRPARSSAAWLTFGSLVRARRARARRRRTGARMSSPRRSRSPPRSPRLAASRIVPQIRRQLPEHWRRAMPMPLAAALYGVLLGLGFTTFVLTLRRLGAGRDRVRARRPGDRAS